MNEDSSLKRRSQSEHPSQPDEGEQIRALLLVIREAEPTDCG